MKDFKHKIIFSSHVRPIISKDKDKYLAMASINDIKSFFPNVDLDKNYDLLAIAFNACIVNRVNKNEDVLNTETAVAIANLFINKPINVEHNRKKISGVILSYTFTKFGSNEILKSEDLKDYKEPFNITLGGVIWRAAYPDLVELLEENTDPSSQNFESVYASWELGFEDYELVILPPEEKNTIKATIISDAAEIEKFSKFLKANGGTGKNDDGDRVYRQVKNDVLPLGIGLTGNPAADVTPVLVNLDNEIEAAKDVIIQDNSNKSKDTNLSIENIIKDTPVKENEKSKELISQVSESNVKKNSIDNIEKNMKITKIEQINDESLKQISASDLNSFISTELQKASEKFEDERKSVEKAKTDYNTLTAEHNKIKEELENVKKTLKASEEEKALKDKQELFSARMEALDKVYDLSEEDRKIVASQIKDLDEKAYAEYEKNAQVLLKEKNKEYKTQQIEAAKKKVAPVKKDDDADDSDTQDDDNDEEDVKEAKTKKKKNAKASQENADEVVDDAIEKAKKDALLPNAAVGDLTIKQKYAKAFAVDQFNITN